MKVAFGLKPHSGWAALITVARRAGEFIVADRRRIELVDEEWAKQPYHAAEGAKADEARKVVQRGVDAAHRIAARELRASVKREQELGNKVTSCAVLVGNPMPPWSTDEILAVHFRMHHAEGALFQNALVAAGEACGLRTITIPEKELASKGEGVLKISSSDLGNMIKLLGKSVGPPWGKDQKDAALAAMIALQSGKLVRAN